MATDLSGRTGGQIGADSQAFKLTLELVDSDMKQARYWMDWKPGETTTSFRIGLEKAKVEFDSSKLRQLSPFIFNMSVPTIAYGRQFLLDSERIMTLSREEVQAFEWIVGWCHDGAHVNAEEVRKENADLTVDQWIHVWSVADVLGIDGLPRCAMDVLYTKMLTESGLPSSSAINRFSENWPYKPRNHDCGQHLWAILVTSYACRTDTLLDRTPRSFDQNFLGAVDVYRRDNGLSKPGELTAFSKPEDGKKKSGETNESDNRQGARRVSLKLVVGHGRPTRRLSSKVDGLSLPSP